MADWQLIIGNRNYSSWSMRPWLALRHAGIAFEETVVALFEGDYKRTLLQYSPAGKVPALLLHGEAVWDSLAICETIAEHAPALWPADPLLRARARSVSAEMHAGFAALRAQMPMNLRARDRRVDISDELRRDIDRVEAIWRDCRAGPAADGGPWLFGGYSIADAMFAPVVARFRTYGVTPGGAPAAYMRTTLADPALRAWYAAAEAEPQTLERVDRVGL